MCLRQIIVVSILACSLATSAQANERAWFLAGNSLNEVAVTAGGQDWTAVGSVALPPHEPISPILWGGGRYILWFASRPEGHWFVRYDTRLRQLAAFPLDFVPWSMAIDRLTTHIVVLASSAVYLVDVGRLSVVGQVAIPPPHPTESRSLAVARERIFVGRTTDDGSIREVVVFHAASLTHIRTIPGVWYAQASRDETRVYLQTGWPVQVVQVWEPGTLTLIHTGTAENFVHAVGDAIASEYRIPGMFSTAVSVRAYDRNWLNVVFQANVDVYSRPVSDFVLELQQASPHSPIVLRSHTSEYGVRFRVIHVFDPATLAPVREMRDATFDTLASKLLMLAPPDQPTGLHAVVNARTALLTWIPSPDVGEYEVIVGTAPGLSNVGRFPTGGVPLAWFCDIPAGTFYVRVRAINEQGAVESAETSIYVPDWRGLLEPGVIGQP